jgi:hypothetical protein
MKDSTGNVFAITVSQGLPSRQSGEDVHSLISRAGDALYKDKEDGRSRVGTSTGLGFLATLTNETPVICGRVPNGLFVFPAHTCPQAVLKPQGNTLGGLPKLLLLI